jgi:hypothetical protein
MSQSIVSSQPIRLVPLLCVKCRAPIPAQPDEVAWVCEQCGQGLLLNPAPMPEVAENATQPIQVFFSNSISSGTVGRPFWVTQGKVTFRERQTYKGNETAAAKDFWSVSRLFYVPAWACSLEEILSIGGALLKNPFSMNLGSPCRFAPVILLPSDLQALAEFMVINIEAERRDWLKSVLFDLKLEKPQLWIMP